MVDVYQVRIRERALLDEQFLKGFDVGGVGFSCFRSRMAHEENNRCAFLIVAETLLVLQQLVVRKDLLCETLSGSTDIERRNTWASAHSKDISTNVFGDASSILPELADIGPGNRPADFLLGGRKRIRAMAYELRHPSDPLVVSICRSPAPTAEKWQGFCQGEHRPASRPTSIIDRYSIYLASREQGGAPGSHYSREQILLHRCQVPAEFEHSIRVGQLADSGSFRELLRLHD